MPMVIGSSPIVIFRAPLRVAAVGGLSGLILAAITLEESVRAVSDERRDAYVRRWARSMLKVLAVSVEIEAAPGTLEKGGRPRLVPRRSRFGTPGGVGLPRVVVANHRSTLDILVLLDLFGGHLLARGDMAEWPAIGVLAKRAGTLFVDRADPASGAAAVQRIRERLRRGVTISVFPEGTTFEGDEVREFQAGAFVAIARERGEIVPVGIAYERPDAIFGDEPAIDHMKRLVRAPSFRVGVSIGTPILATASRVGSLAATARAEVQALVHRARARLGSAP